MSVMKHNLTEPALLIYLDIDIDELLTQIDKPHSLKLNKFAI